MNSRAMIFFSSKLARSKLIRSFLAAFVGTGLYLFQQTAPADGEAFNLSVDVGDGDCAAFQPER